MAKLWGGRFEKETDQEVDKFSTSIFEDHRMWRVDLEASMAHARMLGAQGIITLDESAKLIEGLGQLIREIESGALPIAFDVEDIHSFIEVELGKRAGDVAKKLHTARSRNDQVATDSRLFLSREIKGLIVLARAVQTELLRQAENETETILPGMTHTQHAQPVSLAHHLMAYFWMLQRDAERLQESLKRVLTLPLGAAALAGTGFPVDREKVAKELGFERVAANSLDAVSDRDFVIEFASNCAMIMMHLSRLSEELIMWSTPEFAFVELGDEVTTGSSIMPQKKNPDVAELIRGKVGRVYGALMGSLTMMKGLPLAYNRDQQEDKYHLMESLDTTRDSLKMTHLMLTKANWRRERMQAVLARDFSNATDLADDLVLKGLTFREAHEVIGRLVRDCIEKKRGLEELTLNELKSFHPLFDAVSLAKTPHKQVLMARTSQGGTAPEAVRLQIEHARKHLATI